MNRRFAVWGVLIGAGLLGTVGLTRHFLKRASNHVPPAKIALVDGARVASGIRRHPNIDLLLNNMQQNILRERSERKERLKKLSEQARNTRLPAKKRAEFRELQRREAAQTQDDFRRLVNDFQQKAEVVSEYENGVVFDVISKLSKKYNISLVLNTQIGIQRSVLYMEKTLDLTDEVIEIVNKHLAKVSKIKGLNY